MPRKYYRYRPVSDIVLASEFQKGIKALSRLIKEIKAECLKLAMEYLKDQDEAEEVFQICLDEFQQDPFTFNPNLEVPFISWFKVKITFRSIDALRKKEREQERFVKPGPLDVIPSSMDTEKKAIDRDEVKKLAKSILEELTEEERVLFCLKAVDEKTYHEISVILDKSISALQRRYKKIVRKLERNYKGS